ncbi:MAG: hypothetical protein ACJ8G7_07650 [Rhizobacter sp.]
MADRHDNDDAAEPMLSRRRALTAAGLMAATAVAAQPSAHASDAPADRMLGVVPAPANAAEFRARVVQSGAAGERFAAFGYITGAHGANDADLFAGTLHNETTALLTAYAAGSLVQRTLDRNVHSLDIEGTLTIHQRVSAGASFAVPDSFQVGTPVARFQLSLQDILTVFLPARGIPTLTGAMHQTLAASLAGPVAGRRFGHIGSRARFFATGLGDLVDPVTLNAALEMAGNWVIE